MGTKTVSKSQMRPISIYELRTCPKYILSASHWTPVHKVEECGANEQEIIETKPVSKKIHSQMFIDSDRQCVECKLNFTWTSGEQRFLHRLYDEGKIKEIIEPRRCPDCRTKKKARIEAHAQHQDSN